MEHLQSYHRAVLASVIVLCALASFVEAVPADRYMPPSWVEMCQAEVTPFKPELFTSHPVFDLKMSAFGPSSSRSSSSSSISVGGGGGSGSGSSIHNKSQRNPFIKPAQEFRDKIKSMGDDAGSVFIDATSITTINGAGSQINAQAPLTAASTITPSPTPTTKTKMNNITCKISKSDNSHWKLMDLHKWQTANNINSMTTPSNRTVVFSLRIECELGANISLPWPMKSKGLLEIHVRNCGLVDQFSLASHPLVSQIPDELQVLDIRDSFWLVDLNSKNSILENTDTDFINIDSDYDCGQDESLRVYISRNVTFTSFDSFNKISANSTDKEDLVENGTLAGEPSSSIEKTKKAPIKPEDRLITNKEALISDHHTINVEHFPNFEDVLFNKGNDTGDILANLTAKQDFFELLKKIKNTRIQCDFVKLLVRDESLSSDTPRHLLQVSTQEATHPVLEILNYSSVGMVEFPRELSQWRLYFPRLLYLDLSHNRISNLKVENYPLMPDTPTTVINVRNNNMTTITPQMLKAWASVEKFHLDFSHNPISCNCDLKSLISYIKNESIFSGNMLQYEYIKYMHCNSPANLKGRRLKSLDVSDLPCPVFESSNDSIIALAVLLGAFVILTIVLIRFKFEIRILLYTRLHLRLPCDSDVQRNAKLYDAFVSYSNQDSDWVLQNLVSYLEKNDAIPTNAHNGVQNGAHKNPNSSSWNSGVQAPQRMSNNKAMDHRAFKLCLHQRDFIPGKTIVDNIVDSIEASRHTIIVLSPSFMKSHWAMEELRQAYRQSLVEKTRHLIVVLLEKVPDHDMDPLIRRCVKTFTYLQVQDAIFKDKLVFSLSTKDRATRRRDRWTSKQQNGSDAVALSKRSKSKHTITPRENFTYIHDMPSLETGHNSMGYNNHRKERASNEYETVQSPSSSAANFPCSLRTSTSTQNNDVFIRNGNEMFQGPAYYGFPSQTSDDTIVSTNDNGYYSLGSPNNSSPKLGAGECEYESPIEFKVNHDDIRPDAPARVLSNCSTSSTTALTWNL